MPSAAWITASKRTPMEPVFYAACESVDAINVTQNLASDWNAGAIDNLDVFSREGGGAGLRPKLYTYNKDQVSWWSAVNSSPYQVYGGFTVAAPVTGFLEYVDAIWSFCMVPEFYTPKSIHGWPVQIAEVLQLSVRRYATELQTMNLISKGLYQAGVTVPFASESNALPESAVFKYFGSAGALPVQLVPIYPHNAVGFEAGFRAKTGTITTAAFDLGTAPNINSRIFIEDMVAGASSIVYVCEGSETGTGGWVSLGPVSDGREVAPYRYYRFQITFTSTGYDTPELYSIRVVGGNQQLVSLGTHRGEPALPVGEVAPYLQKVSTISSKISLKDKPTVGDLTLDLLWMPLTSDLVQSTGKRRSVTVYLGFVGLPKEDYEPYFTGAWESYTGDQEKRTFTVKLRDVWKKFKKQIPDRQNNAGVRGDAYHQFGQSSSGAGTQLNIIDAMVQVADLAKAPDRFIDRAEFAALKAAHYSGPEWNVYRVLTDQKDSDELLKELAVTAGLFLVPYPNGKLTPLHYETLAAGTPAVTLDAAQIKFTNLVPDMAETVTRHNVYFNLIEDGKGRRSGGTATDYSHVYTTLGSTNSVIAERDREEVITGEWFDNWGLAAGVANGIPNPLTQLADRLESWYTPVANVGGKDVSTTKVSVKAENVPLRYWSDVMPGCTVMVDNLRLPCPAASWEGFSDQVKFLVMARNVDPKNFTLSLDLFQIAPLSYNPSPTWYSYDPWDLYPQPTNIAVGEFLKIGTGGTVSTSIEVTFTPALDYRLGYHEIWVSEGGANWVLQSTVPLAAQSGPVRTAFPAQEGVEYRVAVVTVTARGKRQPIQDAQQVAITPLGKTAPPPDVDTFSVTIQEDGTRQFSWMIEAPLDLDGYFIKYAPHVEGVAPVWSTMTALFSGLVQVSPLETNLIDAGVYDIGIVAVDTTGHESANPVYIQATLPEGRQVANGVPGPPGADGITYYTWIKYATSGAGAGLSDDPTGKTYIGFAYNKTTAVESSTPGDYTWSLIQGPQGNTGEAGADGADGVTTYTWIKYADVADGTGLYDTPTASTQYIGIAVNKTTAVESTVKADYTWSKFKGDAGANAVTVVLSNEAHVIPCDSAGTPSSYTGSGTDIYVYENGTPLGYVASLTAGCQFTVTKVNSGITGGAISAGSGKAVVAAASAMTTNPATVTFTITARKSDGVDVVVTKTQTFTKSVAGAAGATGSVGAPGSAGPAGPVISLTANKQVVSFTDNVLDGGQADITFTATRQNVTDDVTWQATDETGTVRSVLTGTSNTGATLTIVNFGTTYKQITVRATAGGVSDVITVIRLNKSTAAANATSDLALSTNGNCTIAGNKATKTAGTNGAWDADVYSLESHTGGCYCQFRMDQLGYVMAGLNAHLPSGDGGFYSWLEYMWYPAGDGNAHLYYAVSGAPASYGSTSYVAGDIFAITYDGSYVRYLKNGEVIIAIQTTAGRKFYFDSSFHTMGNSISGIKFGPMTSNNWASVSGTGKPADNATRNTGALADLNTVNTNEIASGATYARVGAYTDGSISTVEGSDTFVPTAACLSIQTATIVTIGGAVSISFACSLTNTAGWNSIFSIFRVTGGVSTIVYNNLLGISLPQVGQRELVSLTVTDNPSAGTHTYHVRVADTVVADTLRYSARLLLVEEYKR